MPKSLIIDAHTHAYPDEALANPSAWADKHHEPHWKSLVTSTPSHTSIQGWANRQKFLSNMEHAGVSKTLLLGWYWENQATCTLQNNFYAEWLKQDPDRFIYFAAVQAREGSKALDAVKAAVDQGAKGIGEIFPQAQGFSMQDPNWLKIVELAIKQNLPINLHVTEPVGHDYPGKIPSPLEDYLWLAKEFPELKIILAHWGGLLAFYELNPEVKKKLKNVYYDTAASPLLYDNSIFKAALDVVGPEKILYGSDYPLRLYPKTQKEPNFIDFLENIKGLSLDPEAQEKILSSNLLRLLG